MYDRLVIRDFVDLTPEFYNKLPGVVRQGARSKFIGDRNKIEVLSVKFTRVGETVLSYFPNLKWVVNRSTGADKHSSPI